LIDKRGILSFDVFRSTA